MDKQKLRQYRALVKESPKLKKDIDKLYKRLEDVPVVAGKVTRSSTDHPYIEEHMTVQMEEPKAATEIKKQIAIKESRLGQVERDRTAIESFIARIENSTDRLIFDYVFVDDARLSQMQIGEVVGCDQATISRTVKKYLKDA